MQTLKKTVAAPRGASKAKTTTKAGKPHHEAHVANTRPGNRVELSNPTDRMGLLTNTSMLKMPEEARDVLGATRALELAISLLGSQTMGADPLNAGISRMVSLAEQLEAEAETMCRALKRRAA